MLHTVQYFSSVNTCMSLSKSCKEPEVYGKYYIIGLLLLNLFLSPLAGMKQTWFQMLDLSQATLYSQ